MTLGVNSPVEGTSNKGLRKSPSFDEASLLTNQTTKSPDELKFQLPNYKLLHCNKL